MNRSCWLVAVVCFTCGTNGASADLPQFAELVKRTSPAVVNISATRDRPTRLNQFNNE